ncbi:MAG: arylsulfatase [Saprospiraceae bacterium]|nr:arylsulfatase [Saprospiraceae bacterium]
MKFILRHATAIAGCFFLHFTLLCAQPSPNVILILTDDQGWGDLHCHGNDSIFTPNLDRLAAESVEFDRFYVSPLGAQTRASLLTGRYALRSGVSWIARRQEVMRSEALTMAEVFRDAGYRTAMFGKWHNGAQYPNDPKGQGFDEFLGFYGGHLNNYFNPMLLYNGREVRPQGFITDILTDSAIQYIARAGEQPFFCYLAYNAPHSPFQCPDVYFDKYKRRGLSDKNAAVYGMIENADDNIGRLLHALDSLGIRDRTYVVFLSDNGPNGERYNGGMRGKKASVYEGGIRASCIIHRRNYLSPRHMPHPAAHIDLLPTLTGLCEISLPKSLVCDGLNLSRVMQGAPDFTENRAIFSQFSEEKVRPFPGALRLGRYTLVLDERGKAQLFDLADDPVQEKDLSDSLTEKTRDLKNRYLQWYGDVTRSGTAPPPVPVGWKESPRVILEASDAILNGALRYSSGRGWTDDWLEGWSGARDTAAWVLEVHETGVFSIGLLYNCDGYFADRELMLSSDDGNILPFRIAEPFMSEEITTQDRVPRSESAEKVWKNTLIGQISLQKGMHTLRLYLPDQAAGTFQVKGLVISKL